MSAAALLAAASLANAQTTKDEPVTETDQTTTTTTTTENTRLAAIDTSAGAFRKLDADGDGRISAIEAANEPKVAAAFTQADKNKDGYLTPDEFKSLGRGSADPDSGAMNPHQLGKTPRSNTLPHPDDPGTTTSQPPR
jgi:hypothetical protein